MPFLKDFCCPRVQYDFEKEEFSEISDFAQVGGQFFYAIFNYFKILLKLKIKHQAL